MSPARRAAAREEAPAAGAATRRVQLLFVDEGSYHRETVSIPAGALASWERLIDCLREEPAVLEQLDVDVGRLCAAYLLPDGD